MLFRRVQPSSLRTLNVLPSLRRRSRSATASQLKRPRCAALRRCHGHESTSWTHGGDHGWTGQRRPASRS
eukprot:7351009-Prymnesium_polylepis.2